MTENLILVISDQYATFCLILFYKMADGGHFGWPKITFDRISRHFRSICNSFFQNGRHRPFWILIFSKIERDLPLYQWLHQIWNVSVHFWYMLWNAQAFSSYLHKMAAGGHFGVSDYLQNRLICYVRSSMTVSNINLYAHWCRNYVKHKSWRAAAAAETGSRPKP